jgi:ribose transport system substrate-binding protein
MSAENSQLPLKATLLGLLAAAALVVTACGSESSSSADTSASASTASTSSTSAATDAGASDCVTEATAAVEAGRAEVPLQAPSGPLKAEELKGKTIWVIDETNVPLFNDIEEGIQAGASALGMNVKIIGGKGSNSIKNQGVAQAVAQKAAGIILLSVVSDSVSGPLADAEKAGIPVIDTFTGSAQDPLKNGVLAHVTADFAKSGAVMADWMLADSGCDLNAGIYGGIVHPVHKLLIDSSQAEIKRLCPDCSSEAHNVDFATMATSLPRRVQNDLRRNPDLNYLFPVFDGAASLTAPAVQQAGSDVTIVSHDGVDANLDQVRQGGPQLADMAFPPPQWIGWAATDQIARAMTGEPLAEWEVPVRLIDETNIGDDNAALFGAFNGYEEEFQKQWGVS